MMGKTSCMRQTKRDVHAVCLQAKLPCQRVSHPTRGTQSCKPTPGFCSTLSSRAHLYQGTSFCCYRSMWLYWWSRKPPRSSDCCSAWSSAAITL